MRAVRKVSVHFEYLENQSRGQYVTWQQVRGDLTVHLWTVTLPCDRSAGSETPLAELVYCVTVAFTMTERADQTMHLPILQHFFLAKHQITLLQPRFGSLRLLTFPKPKIAVEREEICECVSHTVHKHSQWRFTADWLDPRESDCSQMCSKVSSYWLPRYIEATRPVLEIFKMDRYFLDSPRISIASHWYKTGKLQYLLWCTNFPHAFFVTWPCRFSFKCMYIFCYLALFTLVPFMTAVTTICIFIALSLFPAFL
jgi:hypothetical protein